jgi:hypothetical protein
MTLEEAIQQRWNGDAALTSLVPIERIFTSFAPVDTPRPYVVVERRRSKPALRTSSGLRAAAVELVFRVAATGYDEAAAIAAAVAAQFDGVDFDAGEGYVAAMQRGEETRKVGPPSSAQVGSVAWELQYDVTLCFN